MDLIEFINTEVLKDGIYRTDMGRSMTLVVKIKNDQPINFEHWLVEEGKDNLLIEYGDAPEMTQDRLDDLRTEIVNAIKEDRLISIEFK